MGSKSNFKQSGQSLIELLVGITVGIIFIVGALGIITVSLRVDLRSKSDQSATELARELLTNVEVAANEDWHNIDLLTLDSDYHLFVATSSAFFSAQAGPEIIELNEQTYTRSFSLSAVRRSGAYGTQEIITSGGQVDPLTLLVTVNLTWSEKTEPASLQMSRYLTRHRNRVFHQTNWSGGSGQEGPITSVNTQFATSTNATTTTSITIVGVSGMGEGTTTNFDETFHWGWNDIFGWINFASGTTKVTDNKMTGYALAPNIGYIAFDCATAPGGPQCEADGGHDWEVLRNDNSGVAHLSGFAWNDAIGWISFCGETGGDTDCSGPPGSAHDYQVQVDLATGDFHGFAWNDIVGWIGFNCADISECDDSDFKAQALFGTVVSTATVISSTFNTQRTDGAAFYGLMWQGTQPSDTNVKFQFSATDDSSGPDGSWDNADYIGPDGTSNTFYQPLRAGAPVIIDKDDFYNKQYARYKVILESDASQSVGPTVDDVIILYNL